MSSDINAGLTPRELMMIGFIRQLGWGEIRILVQNGEPVLLYESMKTVRLDEEGQKAGRESRKHQGLRFEFKNNKDK